jgi:hypothetical protein
MLSWLQTLGSDRFPWSIFIDYSNKNHKEISPYKPPVGVIESTPVG